VAAALRAHRLDRGLHDPQRAEKVHVQHLLQVCRADLRHRRGNHHAGVVDDDVDAPEALDGLAEARLHGRRLRDVGRDRQRLYTVLAGRSGRRRERLGIARDEHHVGARSRERESRFAADAARRARHEDSPVLEPEVWDAHGASVTRSPRAAY
jgi:hypothetical protein